MAKRRLTIQRRAGVFPLFPACVILSDEARIGSMEEGQMEFSCTISKGEHAIQAQIQGEDGRLYRSNSYFSIGGKDVNLFLTIDGSKLLLTIR